jgi:hypothetical protein
MMLVERRNDWKGGDVLTRPGLIAAIASALLLGEASAQGS